MRPSLSVTLEPTSERGGPWGRDLYTFVTSAAGHMMRTLQKPRKNRPSKRQVNHRRFLHNMIQSKFADIEAANHRLASALYFKDEEKNVSSLQSQKPETTDQLDNAHGISKLTTDSSVASHQTEVSDKKQVNSGHLWKRHPKSQSSTCAARKNSRSKGTKKSQHHKVVEFTHASSPKDNDCYRRAELLHTSQHYEPTSTFSDHAHTVLQDAGCVQNVDISPSFSPLSLDSCDFSIQMFTDISASTHSQRSVADFAETQWTDIMDLFSGNNDTGGCMDVEAYFESICACQGDGGQETGDYTFSHQSDNLTENNRFESQNPHCARGEYRRVNAFSCHEDQGQPVDHHTAETQFTHFKPAQDVDITQRQLQTLIDYHHNVSELQACQRPQEETHCMLGHCENQQNFTPFEGVARSFSAPLHNPEHRPIPTPPHEDDWLFTDILKDRKSPDCALSNVCGKKYWAPCDCSPAVNTE
ncbi:hypothetical protein Q5P01_011315 [Channa striata]|uniref:Uncharacterized protein n=1 Tax=Channa striata TaxID=64152 RepID=A0AA88MT17_CHASR|nr:hypothetical protein Q5P01_011315 [Channa striata]